MRNRAATVRRHLVVAVVAAVAVGLLATPALAVSVPTEPPTEPPVPLPTEPLPGESPAPDPSPSPTTDPATPPTDDPSTAPSPQPTAAPTTPDATPSPVPAGGTSGGTVLPDGPAPPAPGGGVDQPQVAPPSGGGTTSPVGRTLLVSTPDGLPGALGGAFVLAFAAVLGGLASSFTTFTLTNRGALVARTLTGEIDMERTRRTRTVIGVALLAVAGLIGMIGYLRISIETLVPVQVVYLASAGFGVVVFAVAGGSLLIAETLRSDEHRVRELESAVATLAGHLAAQVTDPPRLVDRSTPAVADEDPDDTADAASPPADDGPADQPTTRIRTVRRVRPPDA